MENTLTRKTFSKPILSCLAKIAGKAMEGIAFAESGGKILFINEMWAQMHGCSDVGEVAGKQIDMFYTKQGNDDVTAMVTEVGRKGRIYGVIEHLRKDGAALLVETEVNLLRDQNDDIVAIIFFARDLRENQNFSYRLEQEYGQLQQEVEQLRYELETVKRQLQEKRQSHKLTEQELDKTKKELERLATECNHSEQELLESIIEAETPRDINIPFNPQELKALQELIQRLV